jgi:phospholipase/carboxylesterase
MLSVKNFLSWINPKCMHKKQFIAAGVSLDIAKKALIMLHGRGGSANDILGLAADLHLSGFAIIAPEATSQSWYPYSFLSPPSLNEPWLSSSLDLLEEITADLNAKGIVSENMYFLGFSQGACLTLEYVARNAQKYGGVVAFTGGLIGDRIYKENYTGNFSGTPVLLASGDPDQHVPTERVGASAVVISGMGASVTKIIYPNLGHTISAEEIILANKIVFR